MKTTACPLVMVVALTGLLHAQTPEKSPAAILQLGSEVPSEGFSLFSGKPATLSLEPFGMGKKLNSDGRSDAKTDPAGKPVLSARPGLMKPVAIPAEVLKLASEAKKQFEKGDYRAAEKTYDRALAKAPDNPFLLSNKAVALFRQKKYQLAEETLRKAVAIAPEDDFCHCTLGIIAVQQGKIDEAVAELTKALAINPKNAEAHNYLGLVAALNGDQNTALKELEAATAADRNYSNLENVNYDGPSYLPPAKVGDFFTPLERGRFRIPSGKYEPLRPIRNPIVK